MCHQHLAIVKKPYLDLILSGVKTLECRLTRQRRAPYGRIATGHTILLKQSSGPVRAHAVAGRVLEVSGLTPRRIEQLRHRYNDVIMAEAAFWREKRRSRYACLIWLGHVEPVEPYCFIRTHKSLSAWDVLAD